MTHDVSSNIAGSDLNAPDDNRSSPYDAIVVGGGIAGLAAALELQDLNVLVVEADTRVGGRIKSLEVGPYWVNLGAHLFPGPDSLIGSIAQRVGVEVVKIQDSTIGLAVRSSVSTSWSPIAHLRQLPLTLGERAELVALGARLQRGVWEYRRASRVQPGESEVDVRRRLLRLHGDTSLAEYLHCRSGLAGEIVEAAAHRAGAEPAGMAAGAGLSLFAHVWGGRKSITAGNVVGGTERLPKAMARAIGESRILTGTRATAVIPSGDRVAVQLDTQGSLRTVEGRVAILTTPAHVTRAITQGLEPATNAALDAMKYGPFVCLALVTNEKGAMPWDRVYAVATPGKPFNMFFNHSNTRRYKGPRQPGGTILVYAGGDLARRVVDWPDDEIRDTFIRELGVIFPITKDLVSEAVVQRWSHGNAYAAPGRWMHQGAIERPIAGGRIQLAGDYFVEDSSMDDAARTGVEAATRARTVLSAIRQQ